MNLLLRFEQSQTGPGSGGDGLARATMLAIAQAGSLPSSPVQARTNKDFVLQIMKCQGEWDDERPWRWIAAVVEEAEREGSAALVAHAGLFTFFYSTVMAPGHTQQDYFDIRLSEPSSSAAARIYSAVLRVLPRLDQHSYVVRHSDDNAMQVLHVLTGCAIEALKIEAELDGDVVSIARRVLGRANAEPRHAARGA